MKSVFLFCCVLFVIACSEKPRQIIQETYPKLIIVNGEVKLDDAYAASPLYVDNFKVRFSDFTIRKQPVQNDYIATQIDTVFHLSNGMDSLKIYQFESKQFLLSMNILTKRVLLNREIFLGMTKRDFYRKFEALDTIRTKPDSVLIWMTTSRLDFIFKSDTLSQITWESEID